MKSLSLAALVIAGACGAADSTIATASEDGPGTGIPTVTRDSAGITIVDNGRALWDSTTAWVVSAEPVLRIGATDGGDPAQQFALVRNAVRLSDGRIAVAEMQREEIRWFAPDGTHLYTRGGNGRGPGEFNSVMTMLRLPGDTIVAQDAPLIKHVFYDSSGNFVREERPDFARYRAYGRWVECLTLTLPDRSLLGCQEEEGLHSRSVYREGLQRTMQRYALVPWDMSARYPLGLHGGVEQFGARRSNGELGYIPHPFHPRTEVAGGGNPIRVGIALNPQYSIEIWRTDGILERIVRRPAARRAATPAELAAALESVRRDYERGDAAYVNRAIAAMDVPDTIPAIQGMAFGPAGDLWVQRTSYVSTAPSIYDVFNSEGLYLGRIPLSGKGRIVDIGDDYVLTVRLDGNDVPFVEMYTLDRRVVATAVSWIRRE